MLKGASGRGRLLDDGRHPPLQYVGGQLRAANSSAIRFSPKLPAFSFYGLIAIPF